MADEKDILIDAHQIHEKRVENLTPSFAKYNPLL